MAGLTGDFNQLGLLIANLRKLSDVPDAAAPDAAKAITVELKAEYSAGKDPYGKSWAPLRPSTLAKGRTPPPLTDKGKLSGGTEAKAVRGQGIVVTVGEPYGYYHQKGTSRMVARPILPYGGMPKAWGAAIRAAITAAIHKILAA